MIGAKLSGDPGLARRLAAKAARLAAAHSLSRALQGRGDPLRWRRARLLWPLFGRSE
jgi:hypothetical protein